MKLHLLNDSALRSLKRDIHSNLVNYRQDDSTWIESFLGEKGNTFISKIDDADVDLLIPSDENRKEYDGINAARIHAAFPGITAAVATDERLWATLCHGKFYHFMKARWPIETIQRTQTLDGIVLQRYFFYRNDPRKSLERNGLSRLWLSAEMTYDPDRENPYELTDVMLQNTNFVFHLFGRKFSSNRDILQGTLEAILMLEREYGRTVSKTPLKEYARRLNLIGGASLLDLWSKEDAMKDAYDFMKPFI